LLEAVPVHFEIDQAVLHLEKYAQVFELGF